MVIVEGGILENPGGYKACGKKKRQFIPRRNFNEHLGLSKAFLKEPERPDLSSGRFVLVRVVRDYWFLRIFHARRGIRSSRFLLGLIVL
jgi:hypothetical protein